MLPREVIKPTLGHPVNKCPVICIWDGISLSERYLRRIKKVKIAPI